MCALRRSFTYTFKGFRPVRIGVKLVLTWACRIVWPFSLKKHFCIVSLTPKKHRAKFIDPIALHDPYFYRQQRCRNAFCRQFDITTLRQLVLACSFDGMTERGECDIKWGTSCKKEGILRKVFQARLWDNFLQQHGKQSCKRMNKKILNAPVLCLSFTILRDCTQRMLSTFHLRSAS